MISDETFANFGQRCLGFALAAFGLLQFIYGDFIPGRAPAWPSNVPGQSVWAYGTGVIFVICGLALLTKVKVRAAAGVASALIVVWALFRQIPSFAMNPSGAAFTFFGKALALVGGTFAMCRSPREPSIAFVAVGRFCLGAFMVLAGVQHFLYSQFVAQLVPAWIPGHLAWTYFAGAALIAGGLGLQINRTRRLAGIMSGAMILSWVFVLHIPRALAAAPSLGRNEWTAVFEALAFSGLAFFYAGCSDDSPRPIP